MPERCDEARPEGEDHREGPPGYDLDEQEAIHDLEASEGGEGGDGSDEEEAGSGGG